MIAKITRGRKIVETLLSCLIFGAMSCLPLAALAAGEAAAAKGDTIRIRLDANDTGRLFEGWGVLSAGATSVFLRDYPEPYRSDILDYLFKPKHGLNIQHLKVEIGSGVDSTCGAEPSHVVTPAELKNPVPRGYEFWLAAEARKRNPDIILGALPWGTPYWTKDYTTKEAADWVVAFLDVAKKHYGLDFQFVGGSRNELLAMKREEAFGAPFEFVKKHLRPALDEAGYGDVQIQMADHYNQRHGGRFKWEATRRIMADPELSRIVPVIGYHYPVGYRTSYSDLRPMPEGFLETGKSHWASEDYSVRGGSFKSAHNYMGKIIREYDELRMTKSIAWAPFTSMPNGFLWHNVGFLDASDCWSGHYRIWPGMWAMAQLTQFADPGWQYMDSAISSCGNRRDGCMYMAMMAPNKKDWSLVAVTGNKEFPVEIAVGDGMNSDKVHLWKSDNKEQMKQLQSITPEEGFVKLTLEGNSIYTLTSTTGQKKGQAAHTVPDAVPGGHWKDDLQDYKVHDSPKYWGAREGTFEIVRHEGRNVLKQIVPEPGCAWHRGIHGAAMLMYGGSDSVSEFRLIAKVKIQDGFMEFRGNPKTFSLMKDGSWRLGNQSGKIADFDPDAWHTVDFLQSVGEVQCKVDGRQTAKMDVQAKRATIAMVSSYHPNMIGYIEVWPGGPEYE